MHELLNNTEDSLDKLKSCFEIQETSDSRHQTQIIYLFVCLFIYFILVCLSAYQSVYYFLQNTIFAPSSRLDGTSDWQTGVQPLQLCQGWWVFVWRARNTLKLDQRSYSQTVDKSHAPARVMPWAISCFDVVPLLYMTSFDVQFLNEHTSAS